MVHIRCVSIALRIPLGSLWFSFTRLLHWRTTESKNVIALPDLAPQSVKTSKTGPNPPKSRFLTAWVHRNVDRCKSRAKLSERNLNPAQRQLVHYLISTTARLRHSHFSRWMGGPLAPAAAPRTNSLFYLQFCAYQWYQWSILFQLDLTRCETTDSHG